MCKILNHSILLLCCFIFSCNAKKSNSTTNLILTNHWFITGPAIESENEINALRKSDGILRVTVNDSPAGEIELNVPMTPLNIFESNEGLPIILPNNSTFIEITYKSSHLIKLQVREGNEDGSGCVHGGEHPRVDIPACPSKFTTIKIPWIDFKLDGEADGKLLDIKNICKFNFVNYSPVTGAVLEITSVKIEHYEKNI